LKTVLIRFLILLLALSPAQATLVVFQWTPAGILLAADSLTSNVQDSKIDRVMTCKIHQEGDIFFTIVGINVDQAARVDLVSIAIMAARTEKGIRNVATGFEAIARRPIHNLWSYVRGNQPAVYKMSTESGPATISIVFASRTEHIVALKEYTVEGNGTVSEKPIAFHGAARGMRHDTGYVAIGVYGDAQAALASTVNHADGFPFVARFIQTQAASEQKRPRPRVGGSACILQIAYGRANWIAGHQGPCANVKP
jgi:hypothetical protein